MSSPDPDVLETTLSDIENPSTAARLLVGTPSRDLFSPEVLLELLMRIPDRVRLECAREVVTALVRKAERTQQEATRTRCFTLIGAASIRFAVNPTVLPTRTITPYQYVDLAPLWGSLAPCECRVVRRSAFPAALEYVRFREWHAHTYCDVPGERPVIHWRDVSSALVRQFSVRMVAVALRAAGRDCFPSELQYRIAQFVACA